MLTALVGVSRELAMRGTNGNTSMEWSKTGCRSYFFQAEDGIRDLTVTGVQTCALPISGAPQWSPDGKQIAFSANPGTKKHIYIVSVDGGAPKEVTKGERVDFYPNWSRDGKIGRASCRERV